MISGGEGPHGLQILRASDARRVCGISPMVI
jgi:hypothetical protein